MYYSAGWLRGLTKEGVEPNPGPTWAAFLEAMKKQLGDEYDLYADDLKKEGKLYTQLLGWKHSKGKNPKMIDADVLFEFVAAERKEGMTAPLTIIFKDDDTIIRNILAVVDGSNDHQQQVSYRIVSYRGGGRGRRTMILLVIH